MRWLLLDPFYRNGNCLKSHDYYTAKTSCQFPSIPPVFWTYTCCCRCISLHPISTKYVCSFCSQVHLCASASMPSLPRGMVCVDSRFFASFNKPLFLLPQLRLLPFMLDLPALKSPLHSSPSNYFSNLLSFYTDHLITAIPDYKFSMPSFYKVELQWPTGTSLPFNPSF